MISFSNLVIFFTVYSVLGYICEVIYCSVPAKKLMNRGFLAGPYCPIYGFGALLVVSMLKPFFSELTSIPILFVSSMIIASALEYFTSWLLEIIFQVKLWDYSKKKFNLNGRIYLRNSILFGVLSVVAIHFVQPTLTNIVLNISHELKLVISSLLITMFLVDTITTLNAIYKLEAKARDLKILFKSLEKYETAYNWFDVKNINESFKKLSDIADENKDNELITIISTIKSLVKKNKTGRRILRSYPEMKYITLNEYIKVFKQSFEQNKINITAKAQNTFEDIKGKVKPTPFVKSDTYVNKDSFASGLNPYKLFWIFFISSVIGYVLETIFCLITRGYIESRQGLIYGPISQIYGIGAVIFIVLLNKLEHQRDLIVFIVSGVVGGVFEYVAGFAQEKLFGTISWEYTSSSFSIGTGRTSLLYMFFWGILGVILIKEIYPRLSRFIELIPNRPGIIISWLLIVLLTYDIFISAASVRRWSERVSDIPANSGFEEYLDKRYPDDFLEKIYPNMQMVLK